MGSKLKLAKIFLLCCFGSACKHLPHKGNIEQYDKAKLSFLIEIKKDVQRVDMSITNMDTTSIFISNPECWINTRPTLLEEGLDVQMNKRIKPDPSCAEKMIELKPHETYLVLFPHNLKGLYKIQENKHYILHLTYYGLVLNQQKENILHTPLESNSITF